MKNEFDIKSALADFLPTATENQKLIILHGAEVFGKESELSGKHLRAFLRLKKKICRVKDENTFESAYEDGINDYIRCLKNLSVIKDNPIKEVETRISRSLSHNDFRKAIISNEAEEDIYMDSRYKNGFHEISGLKGK